MNLSNLILRFNFYFIAFAEYINLTGVATRLGISATQKTEMNDKLTDFNDKILLYVAPDTNNPGTVNDMNIVYKESYILTERFKKQIKANTSVTLTGRDRLNLDIPQEKNRRGHIPVPDISPAVLCVQCVHLMMSFIAFDPTNPFKRAKPKDVASIGVKIAFANADGGDPAPEDYTKQDAEKQTEFEMLFTADQVGKKIYVICYYFNPRGEAGPDSLPCSVVII